MVEGRAVLLVAVGQVADGRLVADHGGDAAPAAVARGVVGQRPAVRLRLTREALGLVASGARVPLGREAARAVAAGPPAAGGVLDVDVEMVAPTGEAQGDGVGRAPLVERAGMEETEQ